MLLVPTFEQNLRLTATMIDIFLLDLSDRPTALRILEIQQAAYAIEAALIGSSDIPPLYETLEQLQQTSEKFYGAYADGVIGGAISYRLDAETLDIYRLMVHPDYFRRGIASALLETVLSLHPEVPRCIVATGSLNEPAKSLYRRHGFAEVGTREVQTGLVITLFEKYC